MRFNRREWLTTAGLLAVGTALEWKFDYLPFFKNTISKKEYFRIFEDIDRLGYETDPDHSVFFPDSDNLSIFLPDRHNLDYRPLQKERIWTLDSNIDFDLICLEGIEGQLDIELFDELADDIDDFRDEWEASIPPEVAIAQKMGIIELNMMFDYAQTEKYLNYKTNPDVPAILYYDLETRAGKIGMEDKQLYDRAMRLYNVLLCNTLHHALIGFGEIYEEYRFIAADKEKEFIDVLVKFINPYLSRIEKTKEITMEMLDEDLRDQARDYLPDTLKKDWVMQVLDKDRVAAWQKTTNTPGKNMVIAGELHIRTFYDNVYGRKDSLITLKPLDEPILDQVPYTPPFPGEKKPTSPPSSTNINILDLYRITILA